MTKKGGSAKTDIRDARTNFDKNNDVQEFYNRIIKAATNTQETLLPAKIHAKDFSRYANEDEYENSLAPSIEFSKQFPQKDKSKFNVIIYNKSNNDGIMSAYIAWNYITDGGKEQKDIDLVRLTSDRVFGDKIAQRIEKLLPKLRGKHVILFDLFYNRATYEAINNIASSFIAIDDHRTTDQSLKNLPYRFSTEDNGPHFKHAACAATWKFFHPDDRVPYYIQYIDAGDSFGHFRWLPQINNFMTVFAVRFTKNQKKPEYQKDPEQLFAAMHSFFHGSDIAAINFLVVLGQVMNEQRDNIKNEVSQTATKAVFSLEGRTYPTYIINFSSPGLTKAVLKNIAARHPEVPFVISWFYNHNYGQFDVSLATAHDEKTGGLDMNELAQKLARVMKGSGGGHANHSRVTFKGRIAAIDRFIKTG